MRKLGLLVLGAAIGAGIVAFESRTSAKQVPTVDELNQRFIVGSELMTTTKARERYFFQFYKDKQTGDCYMSYRRPGYDPSGVIKTDDNACDGL